MLYFTGLSGQCEDEEAIQEEEHISIGTEDQKQDQYDSENSSDVFMGPDAEGDFVTLQRDFCQKYGEHKELYNMYGKPYIPHFLLNLQVLLSPRYLQVRIKKSLN